MARIPIKELAATIRHIKRQISPEYRAYEEDTIPGILLTVATNDEMDTWTYQTGDNSFSGSAYSLPHWAVIGIYRRTNSRDAAREILSEWEGLIG